MNKDRIIQELSLTPFGNKGWMHSKNTPCIFRCDKWDKFGILFTTDGGIVRCMRCGESTSLHGYLLKINRRDLIDRFSAPISDEIKTLDNKAETETREQIEVKLPTGFKRIFYDDYLDERGFTPEQYNLFKTGVSLDMRLQNHIVFPLYQEGKLVSWLARSRKSKEWHKQNILDYKEGHSRLVLRYYNAPDTYFEDILGGYDEIVENQTHTVILVEGLTDKANVDRKLLLYAKNDVKCCFTFGKNLSENQINLLLKKGVKNIILMYDPDALKEIEKFSLNYINKFDSIKCAKLQDRDPGDMTEEDFEIVMNTLREPIDFYINNIKKLN